MALQLIATLVTGLLLLLVALAITGGIDWRSDTETTAHEERNLFESLAGSPVVWVVLFLSLALGLTGVALVAVGGFGISAQGAVTAALAGFGLLVVTYLIGGTYAAARDRNVSAAGATLAAALLVGVLLLVAVSGQLLMG